MEIKLVVVGGKHPGQEIRVPGPKFFIGRAEDCHLRPQSDQVSRRHCAILMEKDVVTVRDFGSKNGTYVNGERVKNDRELKPGDRLKIGPLEFEVKMTVGVGGKKKSKVRSVQEAAARTVEAAGGDDLDITQWLEEADDDTVSSARLTETLTTSTEPTTPPAADPAAEAQRNKEEQAKVVGRFQAGGGKPAAESSRAAAADMLRQFFNNK